jgi:HSP90 family molecular chaperone
MDDCDELMPDWSKTETLQQNKILRGIKKNLVKKHLKMLAETAEKKDDCKKFCEQFGKCLKFGVHEDSTNRNEIAELVKWHSSKSGDEQIGQPGAGSYSGYLVSDKIRVMSDHNEDEQYTWEPGAGGSSAVQRDAEMVHGESKRGTQII